MTRRARSFPPSLAGVCLRYAVMELLGFGRILDADTRARMAEGSRRHKAFFGELAQSGRLLAVEAPVRDPELGVSGRMDAVLTGSFGPIVIEYKTTGREQFDRMVKTGQPPMRFVAQLGLYLEITGYAEGCLIVDEREGQRRLSFVQKRDSLLSDWIKTRMVLVHQWVGQGRLPAREPAAHCRTCDRWRRCFKSEEDRDRVVDAHPHWSPDPPLPVPTHYPSTSTFNSV